MEFNPDTAIDLYNVKKNQVQMISDRGYNTYNLLYTDSNHPRANDNIYLQMSNDDFVMDAWNNINISTNPKDYFNALYINEETGKTLRVLYLEVERGKNEVSVNSIRKYQVKDRGYSDILSVPFGTYRVDRLLFVTPKKLNNHATNEIESNMVDMGHEAEVFSWIELLSICPEHLYNGSTTIIPKDKEKEMVKSLFSNPNAKKDEYYANFSSALPIMLSSDIIARYYGAKSKDVLHTTSEVFTHNSLLRDNMSIRRVR